MQHVSEASWSQTTEYVQLIVVLMGVRAGSYRVLLHVSVHMRAMAQQQMRYSIGEVPAWYTNATSCVSTNINELWRRMDFVQRFAWCCPSSSEMTALCHLFLEWKGDTDLVRILIVSDEACFIEQALWEMCGFLRFARVHGTGARLEDIKEERVLFVGRTHSWDSLKTILALSNFDHVVVCAPIRDDTIALPYNRSRHLIEKQYNQVQHTRCPQWYTSDDALTVYDLKPPVWHDAYSEDEDPDWDPVRCG